MNRNPVLVPKSVTTNIIKIDAANDAASIFMKKILLVDLDNLSMLQHHIYRYSRLRDQYLHSKIDTCDWDLTGLA